MEKVTCINLNLGWKRQDVLIKIWDGKSEMYKSKFEMEKARCINQNLRWKKRQVLIRVKVGKVPREVSSHSLPSCPGQLVHQKPPLDEKGKVFFFLYSLSIINGWYSIHHLTNVGNTSLFVTVFRQRMAKVVENTNVADKNWITRRRWVTSSV